MAFKTIDVGESTNIEKAEYDYDLNKLRITFKSNGAVHEGRVPMHVVDEFRRAPSKGTFFNTFIKGQHEGF